MSTRMTDTDQGTRAPAGTVGGGNEGGLSGGAGTSGNGTSGAVSGTSGTGTTP